MNNLKIVQWNSNGILRKQNELENFVSKHKIDIILLCETKLSTNTKLKIRNFHTYRNDLPPKRGSPANGGTAVLVHRKIVHQHIQLNTSIQSTSIKISINSNETLITAIYKPPNAILTYNDLDLLTNSSNWFISAGDYNAKHPLWFNRISNRAGTTLFNHVSQNDYTIIAPDSPTYFPPSKRSPPSTLDLALVKIPQYIQATSVCELSSDHNPIVLEISSTAISSSPPSSSKFINWKKFYQNIESSQWDIPGVTSIPQIDSAISNLTSLIISNIEKSYFPTIRKSSKYNIPIEILNEIRDKNRLRREWQNSRDPALKSRLNAKTSMIRLMLQTHKQDQWDQFTNTLDPQNNSIYKLNKSLLNKRPASNPLKTHNGLVFCPTEKAEVFATSLER